MIFGKTIRQQEADEQARLKNLHEKREKKFAFFPVTLYNGSKAWLQFVYKQHPIVKWQDGEYMRLWCSDAGYYLEQK